ncbi:hypothetical protein V7x_28660 [Crateriforma conspicua]|uniref:Uncharacterized protein n=1 Tax=Crateriforma conspicua TaxID=2527996 RepID=A0A5C6FVZ6_9PLAN|nr:hypothetical protein [Crateriforma conspicua]TWU67292.1 hypothetical protein V7x_28660 [Crateriforma conspicua]
MSQAIGFRFSHAGGGQGGVGTLSEFVAALGDGGGEVLQGSSVGGVDSDGEFDPRGDRLAGRFLRVADALAVRFLAARFGAAADFVDRDDFGGVVFFLAIGHRVNPARMSDRVLRL